MMIKIASSSIMDVYDAPPSNVEQGGDWNFTKREGMLYVVARAASVGTNGNADHFTYEELKKAYRTFVGKGVFVNHQSQDVEAMRGQVVDAKFIEGMMPEQSYVVCLMEVNEKAFPELGQMIKAGHVNSVSMGICYDHDASPQYILMEDLNYKRYKDVQVGDNVITFDGSVGPVVARGYEYHENVERYVIKADSMMDISVSHDHELLVLRGAGMKNNIKHPRSIITDEQYDFIRQKSKTYRVQAGLSIEQFSELISYSKYKHFEQKNRRIKDMSVLRKICEILNIDFDPITQIDEKYVKAETINVGDYLLSPIYKITEPLDEIDMSMAELLGWYLAEGSKVDKNRVRFDLNINEIDFSQRIDFLSHQIDSTASVLHKEEPDENRRIVFVCSSIIRGMVDKHIFGLSKTKYVSEHILNMEPKKQLALIGSYLDGDGCMVEKSRRDKRYGTGTMNALQISTASFKLCQQIPLMLERSGIIASTSIQNRKPGKNSIVKVNTIEHTIYIGGTYADLLKPFSKKASGIRNTLKQYSAFIYKNYVAVPIRAIEKHNFTGIGYNIQVGSDENIDMSSNHSYVLNNIVSKNCSVTYSKCSICDHLARKASDFCNHVKYQKGGYIGNRHVYEINHGMNFQELSFVATPADSQAKILEIIAKQAALLNMDPKEMLIKATSDPNYLQSLMSNQDDIQMTVLKSINFVKKINGK